MYIGPYRTSLIIVHHHGILLKLIAESALRKTGAVTRGRTGRSLSDATYAFNDYADLNIDLSAFLSPLESY